MSKKMQPKKGESKQEFLTRCRAKNSMGDCAGLWNQARLTSFVDDGVVYLGGGVQFLKGEPVSESEVETPRRFSMLGYTGVEVDWGWLGRFIIDLSGIEAEKEKMPALRDHSTRQIAGVIDSTESGENGFVAEGTFSKVTETSHEVLELADEGFPWQCSIGVRALQVVSVKEGETYEVNGRTVSGPIDVWMKSKVFEVSFVVFGADDETGAAALGGAHNPKTEVQMDAKLKKWLESLGLSAEATDVEAKAFLKQVEDTGIVSIPDFSGDPVPVVEVNLSGGDTPPASQPQVLPQADLGGTPPATPPAASVPTATLSATDVLMLNSHAAQLGLSLGDLSAEIESGQTMAQLTQKMFELAGKKQPPVGVGRIDMGLDDADKFRGAVSAGLSLRMGTAFGKDEKPAPGHEEFRHMSIHEIGRRCLQRMGVNAAAMSPSQVATEVLRLSVGGTSTSDFKSIFMDSTHKRLLQSYREVPQRWRPLVNIVSLSDFREVFGVALSGASDFKDVAENGEYKELTLKDKQESFKPGKKGGIIRLSYEMIVNDDLRAFSKIPQMLGAASARTLNNFVWNLFLSNPVMQDGKELYHEDHMNISLASKLESTSLSKARAQFMKQKGLNGELLDLEAAFLVVPPDLEETASVLLRSSSLPEANMSAGVHNPNAGKLIPISEPRLSAKSNTAWYLVGNPSQVETIDVGFLDGREEPEIFEDESFNTDSIAYKGRICFGAGAMDHVGFARNLGV